MAQVVCILAAPLKPLFGWHGHWHRQLVNKRKFDELHQLDPHSGLPIRVGTAPAAVNELRTVALSSSGRALGILAMRSVPIEENDRALLNTFSNDAALALERAQLREQALRSKLLEEADRFRRGLLGAVSHDLRTPLATIKVASSTLNNRAAFLSDENSRELHQRGP